MGAVRVMRSWAGCWAAVAPAQKPAGPVESPGRRGRPPAEAAGSPGPVRSGLPTPLQGSATRREPVACPGEGCRSGECLAGGCLAGSRDPQGVVGPPGWRRTKTAGLVGQEARLGRRPAGKGRVSCARDRADQPDRRGARPPHCSSDFRSSEAARRSIAPCPLDQGRWSCWTSWAVPLALRKHRGHVSRETWVGEVVGDAGAT